MCFQGIPRDDACRTFAYAPDDLRERHVLEHCNTLWVFIKYVMVSAVAMAQA